MIGEQAQQQARARAGVVHDTLVALWGTELPPGLDPVLAVLTDGVVVDDEAGAAHGLVVQSDELSLDVLAVLVGGDQSVEQRMALLPPELRQRVASVTHPQTAG